MTKYIAYYRVSIQKQGNSGLGLEAQRTDVSRFVERGGTLIAEYQDIESGKNNDRPNLIKAIEDCKKQGAKLLIAKLDRLSRNASFILMLRDSKVDFTSMRTKAALAELKKQGKKLGTPENLTEQARINSLEVRQANAYNDENSRKAGALIVSMRGQGKSFYQITKELNKLGFKTRKGKIFQQNQVQILFYRYLETTT